MHTFVVDYQEENKIPAYGMRVTINGVETSWLSIYLHGSIENDAGFDIVRAAVPGLTMDFPESGEEEVLVIYHQEKVVIEKARMVFWTVPRSGGVSLVKFNALIVRENDKKVLEDARRRQQQQDWSV